MLPALLLIALSFDPPPYAECEALSSKAPSDRDDLTIEDHALGKFGEHEARVRACLEYSGYGYTRVSYIVSVEQADGSVTRSYVEHGMTACPGVLVARTKKSLTVETAMCLYTDDEPSAVQRTTLHWQADPPRLQ